MDLSFHVVTRPRLRLGMGLYVTIVVILILAWLASPGTGFPLALTMSVVSAAARMQTAGKCDHLAREG